MPEKNALGRPNPILPNQRGHCAAHQFVLIATKGPAIDGLSSNKRLFPRFSRNKVMTCGFRRRDEKPKQ
jgi:hypothetical protein